MSLIAECQKAAEIPVGYGSLSEARDPAVRAAPHLSMAATRGHQDLRVFALICTEAGLASPREFLHVRSKGFSFLKESLDDVLDPKFSVFGENYH
ncbi:hypothetical protein K0M31_014071 [Melipona bicolor]|uniref:Uncharacterized protein n=1 Tax=Melipona bicolor TaxID=60889 RepID=A0AA40G810_9HYME|nr:hypothetical protein K0M31_014071 [Melipona bicolor]